ncbi:Cro/CI family transcriptional regulator [Castellaniella denitrificans]|uniref:Cro/CI family transcriptional regulator n=1 Tax=Castellaniella denitrificans TaxID=56119 RepID=A0ABT4M5Z9_9BURK|nr:Cro/CI family transcriptional regulator [Castellaniella denitrificans]MCZ4330753.1 Cro/CI family transcriptional regulator [Castellaniella denitrificans]
MDALLKAVEVVGGVSRLAEMVGVSSSAPSMWKARGRVPVEHCAAIERATGGVVTRRDLRPDDWAAIWPELAQQPQPAEAPHA